MASPSFRIDVPPPHSQCFSDEADTHTMSSTTTVEIVDDASLGTVFNESDFEPIRPLGSGNFSTVELCRHKPTGELYAVKAVKVEGHEGDAVGKELDVLLAPPKNVVKYFGYYYTGATIHMVLENMDAGSLESVMKQAGGGEPVGLPEDVIASAAAQIVVALQDMHDRRPAFIHRDIKPSNILVNRRGEVKLSDFNTARQIMSTMDKADTFMGTLTYMSPERIRGERHDASSDIWSFGLTLYEAANGKYPYDVGTISNPQMGFFKIMDKVVKSPAPALDPAVYSADFCDFLAQCLAKDPTQRATARSLLEHPFIRNAPPPSHFAEFIDSVYPPVAEV